MGKLRLLEEGMSEVLWANVDLNKGQDSIWLTDFRRACARLNDEWEDRGFPARSTDQLAGLFSNASKRDCKNGRYTKSQLLAAGSQLLRPGCTSGPVRPNLPSSALAHNDQLAQSDRPIVDINSRRIEPIRSKLRPSTGTQDQAHGQARYQSRDTLDPLAMDHSAPGAINTFARRSTIARRFEKLDAIMLEGRDSFLPSNEPLAKIHDEILSKTRAVVDTIEDVVPARQNRHLQLLQAGHSLQSFQLLRRIYGDGTSTPEDLIAKIVVGQLQSIQFPIGVGVTLRALVAAAVFEWVFQASAPSPTDPRPAHTSNKQIEGFLKSLSFGEREYSKVLEDTLSE
ncbi:MAG: hypothetical protein Q9209_005045, partial [Squamulea sp. 1 TL-2023]